MKRLAMLLLTAWNGTNLWADPVERPKLYDYQPASGPVLVLKSNSRYFSINCDDSNRMESTIISMGFDPQEKPEVSSSDTPTSFADIGGGLLTEPLYCTGFASYSTLYTNSYRRLEKNHVTYAWNPTKKIAYKLACDSLKTGLDLILNGSDPYSLSDRLFNELTQVELQCASGRLVLNPGDPTLGASSVNTNILSGSSFSYTVQVSDPDGDPIDMYVSNKTCSWLNYNAETRTISGTSYPATVSYNCSVDLGVIGQDKNPMKQGFHLSLQVDPIKISSISTGYRRVCARLNNGKVSCWGKADSKSGKLTQEMTFLQGADLIATNKTFDASKIGIYFTKGQQLFFLKNGASAPVPLGTTTQPIKALKAGPIPACVQTTDNATFCFGDSAENYDVPLADPVESYASFDFGTGTFCGDLTNTGVVQCRYPSLSLDLGAADRPFAAGFKQVCGVNKTGQVLCKSRDVNDTVVSLVPTTDFHKKVSVGNDFACAVTRDNKVKCWGGSNLATQTLVKPEYFDNLEIQDIFSGYDHSCVLGTNAQTVVCWGGSFFNDNRDGVTGVPRLMNVNDMLPELNGWEVIR